MLTRRDSFHRFVVLAFALAAGCSGGDGGKAAAFCKRVDTLCGAALTGKDIAECRRDMTKLKKPLGKHFDRFLSCGIEARSCGEALGCGAGAIEIVGDQVSEQVEAGYEKMLGKSKLKAKHRDDEEDRVESLAEAAATAAKFAELKDKMCMCPEGDAECAKRVSDELTRWSEAQPPPRTNAPAEPKPELEAIGRQLGECMQRAMMPKMTPAP